MTTLLIPLAEENPLLPAWIEMILAVVFVLLLTVVIARFVVPRFEATYAERTEAIQGGIEKAEKAQQAAEAALAEYNAQLAEARTEAARIREDAKTQGTQILAELREQAQTEAARIRAQYPVGRSGAFVPDGTTPCCCSTRAMTCRNTGAVACDVFILVASFRST